MANINNEKPANNDNIEYNINIDINNDNKLMK